MHVLYAFSPTCYRVDVYDGATLVDTYAAGNHPACSQSYLPLDDPQAVPLWQLREWARETAERLAEQHGATSVEYDDDLASELREELTGNTDDEES
jgi:hypothetical protein